MTSSSDDEANGVRGVHSDLARIIVALAQANANRDFEAMMRGDSRDATESPMLRRMTDFGDYASQKRREADESKQRAKAEADQARADQLAGRISRLAPVTDVALPIIARAAEQLKAQRIYLSASDNTKMLSEPPHLQVFIGFDASPRAGYLTFSFAGELVAIRYASAGDPTPGASIGNVLQAEFGPADVERALKHMIDALFAQKSGR